MKFFEERPDRLVVNGDRWKEASDAHHLDDGSLEDALYPVPIHIGMLSRSAPACQRGAEAERMNTIS
jgi:hypothetical protein